MIRVFTFVSGFMGSALFILTTVIGGLVHPGFSHTSQFISELYAVNAPYADALRYTGYLPSGLLITVFGFLALKQDPSSVRWSLGFSGIGIFYGACTVLVSIFNCDEGCNKKMIDPSWSQIIHNATGLLTYLIVPVCLIVLGKEFGRTKEKLVSTWGMVAGIISILMVLLFFLNPESAYAGLIQRVIELSILSWIAVAALRFHFISPTSETSA
jgi:hypothetical membrane protein